MAEPWARVIIVAWNSGDHLQQCVDALARQTMREFEAIIVNNDTPDQSVAALVLPDDRFQILDAGDNLGFAGGSNLGAEGASTEWVITLNPDAFPEDTWLEEVRRTSDRRPEFAMIASVLLMAEAPHLLDGFGDAMSIFGIPWRCGYRQPVALAPHKEVEVFSPCGAAAAYRTSAFKAHGGFADEFFCYLEDIDLAARMRRAGERCIISASAKVRHVGSASTGNESTFQFYHTYRNNLPMIVRSAPWILMLPMLGLYCASQLWILLRSHDHPAAKARWQGLGAALGQLSRAFKARLGSSPNRHSSATGSFLKMLAWSPVAVRTQKMIFHELD